MLRRYTLVVGMAAIAAGGLILVRDLIQVHSLGYAIAGVGMLAFGAWRIQAAARTKP